MFTELLTVFLIYLLGLVVHHYRVTINVNFSTSTTSSFCLLSRLVDLICLRVNQIGHTKQLFISIVLCNLWNSLFVWCALADPVHPRRSFTALGCLCSLPPATDLHWRLHSALYCKHMPWCHWPALHCNHLPPTCTAHCTVHTVHFDNSNANTAM